MTNNQLTREKVQWLHDAAEEAATVGIKLTMNPNELLMFTSALLAAMDSEPVAVPDHLTYLQNPTLENVLSDAEENSPMAHAARILAREVKFWRSAPLYRQAQPAKGLELAGWQFKSVNGDWLGLIDEHGKNQAVREGCEVREVFAMADGVNDRDQVRSEHAEWSQATFGNVGPIGPLKHLRREVLEVIAKPHDLTEWADMQFLMWDAQRRAGFSDEQITRAMVEKLAVNKSREWPEPKDGEPRLHIKEQPAPVVLDEMLCEFYEVANWPDLVRELVKHVEQLQDSAKRNVKPWEDTFPETLLPAYIDRVKQDDDACRAAMLQAQSDDEPTDDERIMAIEGIHNCERCGDEGWFVGEMGITRCACGQADNSPAIPDGYVMVPKEPTTEILDEFDSIIDYGAEDSVEAWRRLLAAALREVES